MYKYLSYIMNEYADSKHTICNESSIDHTKFIHTKSGGIYLSIPIIQPDDGTTNKIKINDTGIEVTKYKLVNNKKQSNYYLVKTNNKQEMDSFYNFLLEYEEKILCKDASKYYQYYDYNVKKQSFKENKINVKKSFNNLFLDMNVKNKLIHDISYFLDNKEKYNELGIPRKIGYLFYGKPGNGKTSIAIALANEYKKNIYKINLNLNKNEFINQIKLIPEGAIVLFEDVDTFNITHERSNNVDNEKKKDVVMIEEKLTLGDILEVLDGYYYLSECIIIMTTNHIEKLDSAFIRPGRVDHKLELHNVNKEQITQIINYFYGKTIKKQTLDKIPNLNISVSELINTIILSHLDDYDYVINYLLTK